MFQKSVKVFTNILAESSLTLIFSLEITAMAPDWLGNDPRLLGKRS